MSLEIPANSIVSFIGRSITNDLAGASFQFHDNGKITISFTPNHTFWKYFPEAPGREINPTEVAFTNSPNHEIEISKSTINFLEVGESGISVNLSFKVDGSGVIKQQSANLI